MNRNMQKWYICINCGEKIGKNSIKCLKNKYRYCEKCKDIHIKSCGYPHAKFLYHGEYATKDKPIDENKLEEF